MKKQTLLFIGAGRMAEAIIGGLVRNSKEYIENIIVSNTGNIERLNALKAKYPVKTTGDWKQVLQQTDVVVLAMPPSAHETILKELSPVLTHQFVVTIAAGIGPSYLEDRLPDNTPSAWIMPNTSATIGESISLYAVGKSVLTEHREALQLILDGIGKSEEFSEEQVHNLTAVTGSAPAFLYYFAETLIEATMDMGIEEETAKKLVIQMIYGSSTMLAQEKNPAALREQVTTPGGATAEGLKVLYENKMADMMKKAIEATNKKARGN